MRETLRASGTVGQDLLRVDWDATPLGDPDGWPSALQAAVRIVLTSRFSMWMAWGPELTFFCNDAYRRDTLGDKYPWALGRPASQVWSEIWPEIGPRIQHVMSTGEATWDERLLLFLERSGFVEETYHTFSYSPLAADDGTVAGMLCVVTEVTDEVTSTRRMATLRDLGTRTTGELTESEALAAASEVLAGNPWALPFTAIYTFEGDDAVRAGTSGIDGENAVAPARLTDETSGPWPLAGLRAGVPQLVPLDQPDVPRGAWTQPPSDALAVPLAASPHSAPYGFLAAGLNPFRPRDEVYIGWIDLVAGNLSGTITAARAYELERSRAETLARIDEAKTDFFANVSHEFRTPLTLLLGPAEDALADTAEPLGPVQRERVEVVARNGERMLRLVNSLLDFSRLESGRGAARFERTVLGLYTAELAELFRGMTDRAGLELVVECDEDLVGWVERDHWAKIVLNLMSNAVKFTSSGSITVRLRDDEGIVLEVADTGAGIPPEEQARVFERFHRVHGVESRTHEGTGIGLALVAELAAVHGGTATVTSDVGRGSTFAVRIPTGSGHLDPEQVVDAVAPLPAEVARRARQLVTEAERWIDVPDVVPPVDPATSADAANAADAARVLVVEDNADMREYVRGLLADEYRVTTASDGQEALELMSATRPDLVLTDVMMPRVDGFELLRRLQADPLTTSIPVIMLSARAGEEGTIEGLEAGAADYLVKPFSARELRARVRVNLELDRVRRVRASLERSQVMLDQAQRLAHVGSFELDLARGEVVVSDELPRLLGRTRADVEALAASGRLAELLHPDDVPQVAEVFAADDPVLSLEARATLPSGDTRLLALHVERSDDGLLRGSVQDVTDERAAEAAEAAAAARESVAAREHEIADALQRSIMPERTFDLEHLDVATYYQAGVEGTQVGGDWYDVIERPDGRTVFVIGDVMGRGVRAASVMGQLRSAARALARLSLEPSTVLEQLDGMVQELGDDQIVTAVCAVFDPEDHGLRYASAGHLPVLVVQPDGTTSRLPAGGPPLGAGYGLVPTQVAWLTEGSCFASCTDGLVERRDRDLDVGLSELEDELVRHAADPISGLPERVVDVMLPDGPDDDVALLIARVADRSTSDRQRLGGEEPVTQGRRFVEDRLRAWGMADHVVDDVVLMASELVTNAVLHGAGPVDLHVRRTDTEVLLEVTDRAEQPPRPRHPGRDDEHGRGLDIVSALCDTWGTRPAEPGKTVWASRSLNRHDETDHRARGETA